MIKAGHPRKQAIAAALNTARKYGRKYASGGEVEEDTRIKSLGGLSDMGAGPEIEQPIEPERPPVRMEPTLQEYQMGESPQLDGVDPKDIGMMDSGQYMNMKTGEVIPEQQLTRRPNVLPLTKTPEGNTELAMPKAVDILGNMMPGAIAPAVPIKAGEMVLSSGAAKTAKAAAAPTGSTADEIEKLLAEYHAQKAAPQIAQDTHTPLDVSGFQKVGPKQGTMPGGWMKDPESGAEWYVKQAPSLEQANNEKLTAELYKLAGVPVADVRLTTLNGKPAIASKRIVGDQLTHTSTPYNEVQGLHENYPVDAWLANHDAVGTGPENPLGNIIVDQNGVAHRIDTGGGLTYKGTGTPKTAGFTHLPDELFTMKDPDYSHLSSQVFGDISPEVINAGAAKVAAVDPMEISKLIERYGPKGTIAKTDLLYKLLKRQEDIAAQAGLKPKQPTGSLAKPETDPFEQVPFTEEDWMKDYGAGLDPEWTPPVDALGDHSPGIAPPTVEMFKPIKPMNIKAFDDPITVVGSITNASPGEVTAKQLQKIQDKLAGMGPKAIAKELVGLKKSPAKLEGWLPENLSYDMKSAVQEELDNFQALDHFAATETKPVGGWKYLNNYGVTADDFKAHLKPIKWADYKIPEAEAFEASAFTQVTPEHLKKLGWNPNIKIHKGGQHLDSYPHELMDPEAKAYEPAWFGSPKKEWANVYGPVGGEYIGRAPSAYEVDWNKMTGLHYYSGEIMHDLILTAKKKGADLVVIKNMSDTEGANVTQFAFLNTTGLRAPQAKFDMNKLHLRVPFAGLAGGGLFSYGMIKGASKENEMNRGGTPKKKAGGGGVNNWVMHQASRNLHSEGMIRSPVPGRTDKLPMKVPTGAYVLPADIPSALGEGNTMAGGQILNQMFTSGPYGMKAPRGGGRGNSGSLSLARRRRADGGEADLPEQEDGGEDSHVPIIAAGGEYIIHPEAVKALGAGDMTAGHKILDQFVLHTRREHIKTLKKLPGPKS